MQSVCPSSDTEPDSDDSSQGDLPAFELSSHSVVQFEPGILEKVACAIDLLESILPDQETEVLAQGNLLIEFLQGFSSLGRDMWYSNQVMSAYMRLAHVSFVNRLFEMRKACHHKMQQSIPSKATDVCWVDAVLAHLGLVSVALASGDLPYEWRKTTSDSVTNHRRRNCVVAAVQLPHSWSSVSSKITCCNSSPAAKQLALRLVFTVYVLGMHLNHYDPWVYDNTDPKHIANCCLDVLHQMYLDNIGVQAYDDAEEDAVNHSMLISLFASANQSSKMKIQGDLVRPHSLSLLLGVVQGVMTYDLQEPVQHITFPRESLNRGLAVLLRCGNLLPWCWQLWTDSRTAGFECVLHLTVTWLYHWDNASTFETDPGHHFYHFIQTYPEASLHLLLVKILHHAVNYLSERQDKAPIAQPFMSAVSKSCWAVCKIMEDANGPQSYVPSLCKCLLKLFFHLQSYSNAGAAVVKELILEFLIHVDDQIFALHLKTLLSEMPYLMQQMAEHAVATIKSMLRGPGGKALKNQFVDIRIILNFFTVCWHKEYDICILRGTASTLLNLTTDLVSMMNFIDPASSLNLLGDLLTVLTVIGSRPELDIGMSPERQERLWVLVIGDARRNFQVAGSFANYVATTVACYDALQCAEAWDYLSSIFLTIMRRAFIGDEELAILTSSSICFALLKLLNTNIPISRFVKSCPWSRSVAEQLQKVLALDKNENCDEYLFALVRRLIEIGTQLNQLLRRIQVLGDVDVSTYDAGKRKTRILYFRSDTQFYLLMEPYGTGPT